MIPHVATCVAIEGRGVLIEGEPGTGKSALALALIDRGARLVGDDGVMLEAREGVLFAHPHPNTRGLLEIRNLGLARFDVAEAVPVSLAILFDPQAPRFIEQADAVERAGIVIPAVSIWPDPAPPALKVEQALRMFGAACAGPEQWT